MRRLLVVLLLSGCTVIVEDRRLTREEVVTAFAQRDKAIETLTNVLNALISKEKPKAAPEK